MNLNYTKILNKYWLLYIKLLIYQITNLKRFEFFIQPQKENIGSASPTYFHVAYGNMEFPEFLIQLTYWITYILSKLAKCCKGSSCYKNRWKIGCHDC